MDAENMCKLVFLKDLTYDIVSMFDLQPFSTIQKAYLTTLSFDHFKTQNNQFPTICKGGRDANLAHWQILHGFHHLLCISIAHALTS